MFKSNSTNEQIKVIEQPADVSTDVSTDVSHEIIELLSLINYDKATDYTEWRNIGFIINNELGSDGFEIFDNFSKRSKMYKKSEVFKFYSSIKKKDSGLKIGSLHKMAKEDNASDYKIKFGKQYSPYECMKNCFELSHFKIINPISFGCIYNEKLVIKSRREMLDTYENKSYVALNEDGEKKQIQFMNEWLKDSTNKTYSMVDFKPCQKVNNDIYNTFKGFEVEKRN